MVDYTEYLKQVLAKAVAAGATVFLSNNGVDAALGFVGAPSPATAAPLKLVSLLFAYAFYQVVVSAGDEAFKNATHTTASAGGTWASRSKLI